MKKIDKNTIYKFLQKLTADRTAEEAVHLLQDIIVNNCIFPGDGEQFVEPSDVDQKIAEYMAAGEKIQAVKYARDSMQLGLKEAKDYVESKNWPEVCDRIGVSSLKLAGQGSLEKQIAAMIWMEKVAKDYET